tara:strand:- start:439 stop:834 length:396 start_codon:yes stop_codon:yes gene_type:complete
VKQISFFLFFLFVFSCNTDNEQDYFANSNFDCNWDNTNFSLFSPSSDCVLENLSFELNILPIINAKCNSCHGNDGNNHGVNLTTYDNLLNYDFCFQIDNDLMPPPTLPVQFQLTQCEKLKIKTWIEDGLAE